ncbi:MAG: hypothetical protein AAGK32_07075 [Actinomycetota bacterium]
MSARNEKYRAKLTEQLAPHVPGEVRAVGMFTRPGSYGMAAAMQVSGLAGSLMGRSGAKKAGGLPLNVLVAVSDDTVHVFDYKPKGTKVKVKDEVATWARSDLRVERAKEGAVASRIVFHLPGDETIELDAPKLMGSSSDFNAPLVELLST